MIEFKKDDLRNEILASDGNLLIMGGPGSGKTTIALFKAKELTADSNTIRKSQKILFLSFARATISRVEEQAGELIPQELKKQIEINTYHGFIWNIIKHHGYLLNSQPLHLLPPHESGHRLSGLNEVERKKKMLEMFNTEGTVHFDIFANICTRLLTESHALKKIICAMYPVIILDEFQDTSADEWQLIQLLGTQSKLIALADPEQRIYDFRGADPKRITQFIESFKPKIFDFGQQNNRSNGKDIAEFGNDLLQGKNAGKSDFTLPTLDDLFSTQAERDDAKLERVRNIPLAELHPFKGHPFKVQNNEEMQRMIESIRKVGAITPVLARPLPDGGYELISGHRRLAACQVLGVETMPVIVRELSDDEAVIAMVDANLQREVILPSEKAFAYKMKRDALNHQGMTSPQVGEKLLTAEKVGLDGGDSRNQVLRYIRLTYLIPELLSMVDDGKIAFNPAVELSYLDSYQQRAVLDAMALNDCTPSHAQSIRLKKLAQEGVLDDQMIYAVLAETKPNQQEQLKFKREELRKYFPSGYTEEQMRRDIIKGLELLKRQRERNRDAR